MQLDSRNLQRFDRRALPPPVARAIDGQRPPADPDVLLIGAGNSGEAVALRCQALGYDDGVWFTMVGLNNDRLAPRPVQVRRVDGGSMPLALIDRLVLNGENP